MGWEVGRHMGFWAVKCRIGAERESWEPWGVVLNMGSGRSRQGDKMLDEQGLSADCAEL